MFDCSLKDTFQSDLRIRCDLDGSSIAVGTRLSISSNFLALVFYIVVDQPDAVGHHRIIKVPALLLQLLADKRQKMNRLLGLRSQWLGYRRFRLDHMPSPARANQYGFGIRAVLCELGAESKNADFFLFSSEQNRQQKRPCETGPLGLKIHRQSGYIFRMVRRS